jgi:hypothetical protein
MWNFIKGVNPPIKKEKLKIKHYYSEYESSERVRSYSTEWEKDRPCSLFLASSTFKYAQNAGFAFKIFKIFIGLPIIYEDSDLLQSRVRNELL